jgi:transcription elongation factor Elf1
MMSNRNTDIRLLHENLQQQTNRHEQKREISFQCCHCGRQQTISLLLQPNLNKGVCVVY